MLKWVVKQSRGSRGGGGGAVSGDDQSIGTGHYRTLSEDRSRRRQRSVDSSSVSSASSNLTSGSKSGSGSKAKERVGRTKLRRHGKATRAQSSSGILEQASYHKVHEWSTELTERETTSNADAEETAAAAGKECQLKSDRNVASNHRKTDPAATSTTPATPATPATPPTSRRITLGYLQNLSHIHSLEKLTNFRDVSTPVQVTAPLLLSTDLAQHLGDEGIDVKEPSSSDSEVFDPNVICGSKMSMMDESFEESSDDRGSHDTRSVKSDAQSETGHSDTHSENRSENGDSSTDSAVVMGDVVTEHDGNAALDSISSGQQGLRGFVAGIQSADLDVGVGLRVARKVDKTNRKHDDGVRVTASSVVLKTSDNTSQKDNSSQPTAPPRNRSRKQNVNVQEDAGKKSTVRGEGGVHYTEQEVGAEMDDEVGSLPTRIFMRGSDPLIQTARGKLQSRRSKLNDQINLELRLRAGAENLYKATSNKKLRETVALELSYVNSTLQLLKEELADMNSSVQVYQSHGSTQCPPMIPLGLKETKDVDFVKPFSEMIEKHYHEDPNMFEKEMQHVIDMRQACRTPVRSDDGIHLLYEYYNQLYFIDRRFFPPQKTQSTYFEWFDSLTGVPNAQRTVGFEKGSILFNIGSLHTQIGARQDRSTAAGIACAAESFQQAAGALQYLNDNFSNAPSTDMQTETLSMLTQLMLAQAQECIFEQRVLGGGGGTDGDDAAGHGDSSVLLSTGAETHAETAHEAARVHGAYRAARERMLFDALRPLVPPSWASMVTVKGEYFRAISHYHTSLALLANLNNNNNNNGGSAGREEDAYLSSLYVRDAASRKILDSAPIAFPPNTAAERKLLAKAHLREAILSHEEALRVHGLSRQLRRMDTFHDILKLSHDQSLRMYAELEEEDDFTELAVVPNVQGVAAVKASPIPPDFCAHRVGPEAVFRALGPVAIFSARHRWSPRRRVDLRRAAGHEYGFSVRGDSPVIVAAVESGSIAHKQSLCVGDFLVAVAGADAKWRPHEDVVAMIRDARDHLVLEIVTPVDRNYLDPTTTSASMPRPGQRGQRSNSHGQLLDGKKAKAATVAVRPSSAATSSSASSRRFSIGGGGTLKKNGTKTAVAPAAAAAGKSKMSIWTLRRNRSKSREKTLEAIAMAGR